MAKAGPRPEISVAAQTSASTWTDLTFLPISDNRCLKVELDVSARKGDNSGFASFRREGFFFRTDGGVQSRKDIHSGFTEKTHQSFDIRAVLGADRVTFQIKAPDNQQTFWRGKLKIKASF